MPEEFELAKKSEELAALESQLVERELELETLRGGLLSFEKKYQAATLERYAQLDELRARIAEIQVARTPDNRAAQLEAAAQRAKAEKTAAAARKYKPKPRPKDPTSKKIAPPKPPPDFNPTETLKRLYRDVAKTIHPDLANDDTERANRHAFMIRANEAYEQNSESRLAEILHEWNSSPESVRGDSPGAELIRAIRKIARCQQRLVTIGIEIEKLTGDPEHCLAHLIELQVRFDLVLVQVELCLPHFLHIKAIIPGLDLDLCTFIVGKRLHVGDFLLNATHRRGPDLFHQFHRVFRRLSHRVLEAPMRMRRISEQLCTFVTKLHDLRDHLIVISRISVISAVDEHSISFFAKVSAI